MNEFFLHQIWMHQSFLPQQLATANGDSIIIHQKGEYNHTNGPDFKSAEISIDHIHQSGDVEIHLKSSDWYRHKHHTDPTYNHVILHVVYEDDRPTLNHLGQTVPTLTLKNRIVYSLAQTSLQKKVWLCSEFPYSKSLWEKQSLMGFKRKLQRKQHKIEQTIFEKFQGDPWKACIWILMRAFLGKHNSQWALPLLESLNKRIILSSTSEIQLKAYFLGMGGWLQPATHLSNYQNLNSSKNICKKFTPDQINALEIQFDYLKFKYQLNPRPDLHWNYKQVRPSSHPEIRIAQFSAWLFYNKNNIESLVSRPFDFNTFNLSFTYPSANREVDPLSSTKKDEIIINGFLLLQWFKNPTTNQFQHIKRCLIDMPPEKNQIINTLATHFPTPKNAWESQLLLSQFNEFCKKSNCLQCLIGCEILGRSSTNKSI